jgi:hypothetical protein
MRLHQVRPQEYSVTAQDISLTLGPFHVDAEGGLLPIEPGAPPAFTFRWRDRLIRAVLVPDDPPERRLRLRARLGRMPSSVRPAEAARRGPGFALLRGLHAALPADWQIGLGPDHGVLLEAMRPVALPITATGLVSEVTCFLLTLAPYLDVLDEAGLAEPSVGTAKT